jgi:hypothetical protein
MKAKLPQSHLVLLSFARLEVYFASFSLRFALFASAHLEHPTRQCVFACDIKKNLDSFFILGKKIREV